MEQFKIKTDNGTVTVKHSKEQGIELHIPKGWRRRQMKEFLNDHFGVLDPLRKQTLLPEDLISECLAFLIRNQDFGCTYNPWTQKEPEAQFRGKRIGYAVALTNNVLPGSVEKNEKAIREFLNKHARRLRLKDMYVGVWVKEETDSLTGKPTKNTFLDLVRVIGDREDAVETGRLRGQEAIFDLDTKEDVVLKDEPSNLVI